MPDISEGSGSRIDPRLLARLEERLAEDLAERPLGEDSAELRRAAADLLSRAGGVSLYDLLGVSIGCAQCRIADGEPRLACRAVDAGGTAFMVAAGDALMSTFAVRTVTDLRQSLAPWRKAGERIALVPTMGALHDGHLSLVALAKSNAARVVTSIFVNPTQFGPREDFNRYPRDEAGDLLKLDEAGANLVFVPDTAEMYPHGFSTNVGVSDLTEDLCGASRPNHFDGVATVVTKLLLQCAPDLALFGEKDYQQLLVIKRLVRDLDIPVEILAVRSCARRTASHSRRGTPTFRPRSGRLRPSSIKRSSRSRTI